VKESWDANSHPKVDINTMLQYIQEAKAEMAVITGGEPLLHNLNELTELLQSNHIETNIETSGSSPLSGNWDWICLSPKKFKEPLLEVIEKANELKIVVFNKSDFEWAEKYKTMVSDNCICLLQPEYSKHTKAVELIVDYVKNDPTWRISLQTHKIINVP
jgi:organic radical activating enzyme